MRVLKSACEHVRPEQLAHDYGDLLEPTTSVLDICPTIIHDYLTYDTKYPGFESCNGLMLETAGFTTTDERCAINVCKTCLASLNNGFTPDYAISNNNWIGPTFQALQRLTLAER
jgi:hypothetical protein